MKSPVFEIKLAILGHVSVGKTTLLNALLGNEFSEVSKKRTTAGISHFSVNFRQNESSDEENSIKDAASVSTSSKAKTRRMGSSKSKANKANSSSASTGAVSHHEEKEYDVEEISTPQETLKHITDTNRRLRKDGKLQEETLEVEIVGTPFVEMRPNTKLVITDIPGVNEARTSTMYLDYVKEAWDTFDCILVVMDADQGVNTEQQVKLLEFVKENIKERKDIPVVILCNKVDEPNDKELMGLVDEVRGEVERIFDVKDKIPDLSNLDNLDLDVPVFLHLSAENAFLYRVASGLDRNDLHKLGEDYIDKIGREEIGKYKWNKLSQEEKYNIVYDVVRDEAQYNERMSASNFDKLIQLLEKLIGGHQRQSDIIEKQLNVQLSKLTVDDSSFADVLSLIHDRSSTLGKQTGHLKDKFWEMFSQLEKKVFEAFEKDLSKLYLVYDPFHALERYESGLRLKIMSSRRKESDCDVDLDMDMDKEKILSSMRRLVQRFCEIICEKIKLGKYHGDNKTDPWTWKNRHHDPNYGGSCAGWLNSVTNVFIRGGSCNNRPAGTEIDQYHSHFQWNESENLWESKHSLKTFPGLSKDEHPLDSLDGMSFQDWSTTLNCILMMKHRRSFVENFSKEINDLEWWLSYQFSFNTRYISKRTGVISVPSSPEDETHWGHLPWMFCNWADKKVEENNNV